MKDKNDSRQIKNQSLLQTKTDSQGYTVKAEIIEIDVSLCKPWDFSDRPHVEMGNIETLAESIRTTGQQEPALIRPIPIKKNNDSLNGSPSLLRYEIIFGNRRWKACKLINKKLLAVIRDLSDQEAVIAQKEENENRNDISDYARAIQYKKLIDAGVFTSQNNLAIKLNISRQRVNDLMAYTRIFPQLLRVIPNAHKISKRLAIKLAFFSKDIENLPILLKLSRKFCANQITSKNIEVVFEKEKTLKKVNLALSENWGGGIVR